MAESETGLSASLAARYAVLETLGEGAMGVVYRAVQLSLDRPVALKVIRAQMLDADGKGRFLQEAKLAARINHPHVVQVYDFGEADNLPFIAFELVNGPPLRRLLEAGPLEPSIAVTYARQVAAGLAAAHEQGIIHRDVKPENILISQAGEAKIADFGISRPAADDQPALTATGTILGSPLYMSPEQASNRTLTGATDQYSLGVVLYEMLVGKPPFEGSTGEILAQHLRDTIALPTAVRALLRADVVEIFEQMVRKEPSRRFPHARELAASLDKALQRWRGRKVSTIPAARPRVPVFQRAGPEPSEPPEPPTIPDEPRATNPRASGARSGSRQSLRTGSDTGLSRPPSRVSRPDDRDAFEREPLPLPFRVGLVLLAFFAVSAIAYWIGRNDRLVRPDDDRREGRQSSSTQTVDWAPGTVIGNVETRVYHVVGETRSQKPSREHTRQFKDVQEAENSGYRRSKL